VLGYLALRKRHMAVCRTGILVLLRVHRTARLFMIPTDSTAQADTAQSLLRSLSGASWPLTVGEHPATRHVVAEYSKVEFLVALWPETENWTTMGDKLPQTCSASLESTGISAWPPGYDRVDQGTIRTPVVSRDIIPAQLSDRPSDRNNVAGLSLPPQGEAAGGRFRRPTLRG